MNDVIMYLLKQHPISLSMENRTMMWMNQSWYIFDNIGEPVTNSRSEDEFETAIGYLIHGWGTYGEADG